MARPRSVSLSDEEMISLGEEMCQWVSDNKPMHLCEWYSFEKNITDSDWDAMRKIPSFLHYYNKALKLVGMQYLSKESPVEPSLKQRWQRVYFKDLKKQEDEDLDAAEERKVKAANQNISAFTVTPEQLKSLLNARSESNSDK